MRRASSRPAVATDREAFCAHPEAAPALALDQEREHGESLAGQQTPRADLGRTAEGADTAREQGLA